MLATVITKANDLESGENVGNKTVSLTAVERIWPVIESIICGLESCGKVIHVPSGENWMDSGRLGSATSSGGFGSRPVAVSQTFKTYSEVGPAFDITAATLTLSGEKQISSGV